MYFPDDMTFQYFFFDTYIGYFLQALPIALVVGSIYGLITIKVPDSGCADVQARLRRCTDIGWANLYEQAGRIVNAGGDCEST